MEQEEEGQYGGVVKVINLSCADLSPVTVGMIHSERIELLFLIFGHLTPL